MRSGLGRGHVATVAALSLAAAVSGCTSSAEKVAESSTGTQSGSNGHAAALPFTAARIAELQRDLRAGDASQLRDAVALPPHQKVPRATILALKQLGTVTFDIDTFTDEGDGSATVTAHSGSQAWRVWLVPQGGEWRIAYTEPVS